MSNDLPGTRTSLLKAIEQDSREQSLITLGVFYERYRGGLANFLTARYGLDAQDANDILHDFLCEKLVDAGLIRSYLDCLRQSQSGHRAFRPYLVRALCNFTIDRLRKQKHITMSESPEEDVLGSEYADLYRLEWCTRHPGSRISANAIALPQPKQGTGLDSVRDPVDRAPGDEQGATVARSIGEGAWLR